MEERYVEWDGFTCFICFSSTTQWCLLCRTSAHAWVRVNKVNWHVLCPQHPSLSSFTLISQTAGAKGLFLKEESHREEKAEKAVPSVCKSESNTSSCVLTHSGSWSWHYWEPCNWGQHNQHVYQFVLGQQRDLLKGLDGFNQAQHSMSWAQRTMVRWDD